MDKEVWNISRRKFIESILLGGVAVQLPWLTSCVSDSQIPENIYPLNPTRFQNLRALLLQLFPDDGNGPNALEINADSYIVWVLNDEELDWNENEFIIEKLNEFTAECLKQNEKEFYLLSSSNQEEYLQEAMQNEPVESLCSRLLTLIFEALLVHPLYGVNKNEVAWKWLEHESGFPKAIKHLAYPEILKKKHEV